MNSDSLGCWGVADRWGVVEETWCGLEGELLLSLVLDMGATGSWLKRPIGDKVVVGNGDGEMNVLLIFFTFSSQEIICSLFF